MPSFKMVSVSDGTAAENALKTVFNMLKASGSEGAALVAGYVLKSGTTGRVEVSSVSNTELEYLIGLTGNIQSAFNGITAAMVQDDDDVTWRGDHTFNGKNIVTNVVEIDSVLSKLGFFGATAVVKQANLAADYDQTQQVVSAADATTLTDNSGGSASDTIAVIGVAYSQAEVANAIASIVDEVNKLKTLTSSLKTELNAAKTDITAYKTRIEELVDRMVAYGLVSQT